MCHGQKIVVHDMMDVNFKIPLLEEFYNTPANCNFTSKSNAMPQANPSTGLTAPPSTTPRQQYDPSPVVQPSKYSSHQPSYSAPRPQSSQEPAKPSYSHCPTHHSVVQVGYHGSCDHHGVCAGLLRQHSCGGRYDGLRRRHGRRTSLGRKGQVP
jgi:hypothetical protein